MTDERDEREHEGRHQSGGQQEASGERAHELRLARRPDDSPAGNDLAAKG